MPAAVHTPRLTGTMLGFRRPPRIGIDSMLFGFTARVGMLLLAFNLVSDACAQRPGGNRTARPSPQRMQQQMQQRMKQAAENQPQLPADPQLLSLHKEFIAKAEKLAGEYERKKQYGQAREVYESLVRLVPNYGAAEAGLQRVLNSQSLQDKKIFQVLANQAWQDSGVSLREGMPVHVEVRGSWKLVFECGPQGIEIPEKMRLPDGRIKLGSLLAVVVGSPDELKDAKPFVLRGGDDFIAKKSGRLYLRMYDVEPSDNEGNLYVMIQSTFYK